VLKYEASSVSALIRALSGMFDVPVLARKLLGGNAWSSVEESAHKGAEGSVTFDAHDDNRETAISAERMAPPLRKEKHFIR